MQICTEFGNGVEWCTTTHQFKVIEAHRMWDRDLRARWTSPAEPWGSWCEYQISKPEALQRQIDRLEARCQRKFPARTPRRKVKNVQVSTTIHAGCIVGRGWDGREPNPPDGRVYPNLRINGELADYECAEHPCRTSEISDSHTPTWGPYYTFSRKFGELDLQNTKLFFKFIDVDPPGDPDDVIGRQESKPLQIYKNRNDLGTLQYVQFTDCDPRDGGANCRNSWLEFEPNLYDLTSRGSPIHQNPAAIYARRLERARQNLEYQMRHLRPNPRLGCGSY